MPKFDAFGREIGEDPLAAWRAEEAAQREAVPAEEPTARVAVPADEPVVAAAPAEPPRPAAPPERPRESPQPVVRIEMPGQRRRPRVVSRLVLLLVVLGLGASLVANAGRELEDAIPDAIRGVPPVEAEGPPPTGLQSGSLVRPAELRRAFAKLRETNLGRAYTLRLAPERIDAQLINSGGVMSSVQLRHDGSLDEFTRSAGSGHLATIPWAELNAAAPARLARRAAARLRQPVTRLNYLVATLFDGRVIWGAYFKGGEIFQGNRRGRLTRRVS